MLNLVYMKELGMLSRRFSQYWRERTLKWVNKSLLGMWWDLMALKIVLNKYHIFLLDPNEFFVKKPKWLEAKFSIC